MNETAAAIPRAEVVGSLLRPPALLAALKLLYADERTALLDQRDSTRAAALDRIADDAIRAVVRRQVDAGLDVVTDGEFRRAAYSNSFYDAVEGLTPNPEPMRFFAGDGSSVEYAAPPIVAGRLRKVASPLEHEAAYLGSLTDHLYKVTLPAGSRWCLPYVYRAEEAHGYATHEELIDAAVAVQRELIAEAVAAGCRYVQLDFPVYPMLADAAWCADMRSRGVDLDAILELALRADRAVIEAVPAGVRTGLHVCRGNHRSRWLFEGSLEPVAARMFGELPYDSFLVEWEDVEREGGYEPLRHVPAGPTVVLGLVSSKNAHVESDDEIATRLDAAARFLGLDQLALSPQCGFASTWHGNELGEDEQWRKLELVGRVADRVWR